MALDKIRKRNGEVVDFAADKIAAAIGKAVAAVGEAGPEVVPGLAQGVVERLQERFAGAVPTVEEVQDVVEETLSQRGMPRTAKAYILYRQRRAEIRRAKQLIGVEDELKLSVNAVYVLKRRYLLRDDEGRVRESPSGLFRRVAEAVAAAERRFDPAADTAAMAEAFYQLMSSLDFLPNSPTLMNAGTEVGQLSACYVLPVQDSIPGIFDAIKNMALVHKSGGGTGFSFSSLRPQGDRVMTTKGIASGPLSFMRIFDVTTDVIKQGGRRRGANMGILRCDHPDILDFITAKDTEEQLSNFNLSVGVTDDFMKAVEEDAAYALRHPSTDAATGQLQARQVFDMIVSQAWRSGDPGVVFLDAIERDNPTPKLGRIEATNPCGEQPLLPWESCNLGSINLKQMVDQEGQLDEARLRRTVQLAVRFLDNVIEVNRFPLAETERITLGNRKIGLGLMGLADALILMGIPYDSDRALEAAERIASVVQQEAHRASVRLAEERGPFPNYPGSKLADSGEPVRNATVTSIAPTGTISIIAGCSSGIEPLFAVSFVRHVIEGSRLMEVNPIFETVSRQREFFDQDLLLEVARRGSIQQLDQIPADVRRLFVTALDISPQWHVRMQAAFQRHCDNAVSKTINFPPTASIEEVAQAFRLAHAHGCKGITIYRYSSKREQVLNLADGGSEFTTVSVDYAGGCPPDKCSF